MENDLSQKRENGRKTPLTAGVFLGPFEQFMIELFRETVKNAKSRCKPLTPNYFPSHVNYVKTMKSLQSGPTVKSTSPPD